LWKIRHFIFDVKASKWIDEYNSFKQGVKDLEVIMQNAMLMAFDDCNTIERSVELIEIFHHLAVRDAIKRVVEKKTFDVYQIFLGELNTVKAEFEVNKKTPLILRFQPNVAGTAYWAKSLLLRIQSPMNSLNSAYFLTPSGIMTDAKIQYETLHSALEDYISKSFLEWNGSVSPTLTEKLNEPLMTRNGGKLAVKFDKDLLRLFAEITYMQRLKCDAPFHVKELYDKKEELRVLKENVTLVVRDYNKITDLLNPQEQLLFKERIRFLDRKVNPALTSLNW
jgi:dynein heavy chain, axonemal